MQDIIVHALVTSRFDYSDAVLYEITGALLTHLQMVQNSAARMIVSESTSI